MPQSPHLSVLATAAAALPDAAGGAVWTSDARGGALVAVEDPPAVVRLPPANDALDAADLPEEADDAAPPND